VIVELAAVGAGHARDDFHGNHLHEPTPSGKNMLNQSPAPRRRRGIFLLPNLFTTAALFFGFYAIVAAVSGRFEAASVAIMLSIILDGIDGRVARITHTESAFGAAYDSLSDMTAFGLAPALLVYEWSLVSLGKPGWLAAFVFTASAALRLARFTVQVEVADKRYFQGLPSPSAAALLGLLVWLGVDYGFSGERVAVLVSVAAILTGILMVSNIRYYSQSEAEFYTVTNNFILPQTVNQSSDFRLAGYGAHVPATQPQRACAGRLDRPIRRQPRQPAHVLRNG